MIHALVLSVPIPAPHLPAALDVGPFVPGVAYTAPKDYYGMPVDAGYAGLINRAQQLERFNRADFPPLERRAAPEPPPAPLPIAAMPLAAAAAEGDQFVALDNPKCVPIAPGTVVALGAGTTGEEFGHVRRLSCFGANATLALERPLRFEHIAGEAVGVMPGRFQVPDGPLQVRAGYGARAEAEHKRVIGLSGRAKEWVRFSLDALSVPAHAWPLPTYGLALAVGLIGAWVAVVLLACGAICVRRAARDYAMASATPIKL